jgi:ubiquinone/menaquinone biosynthesis C-methylase UbiE
MQQRGESVSAEHDNVMDDVYNAALLKCFDIIEREDFYGIVAWRGMRFFGEALRLGPDSHLLDLCSGIGGPGRFLARTYGCSVTGIDLSEFNYLTSCERTKLAGLEHLARFIHGDALDVDLPDKSFTHVFGCEAWCYFLDKQHIYATAHRLLKPGGTIAFLEAACDTPLHLRTGELLGPVWYESVANYTSMLEASGFEDVQHFDTTELAGKDIATSIDRLISNREQILQTAGEEVYFALLEIWAEFTACFVEGKLTHCGFVAHKGTGVS